MNRIHCLALACASALAVAPLASQAHVVLPRGGATADTDYTAVFTVGHACKGSTSTTGVSVELPEGFRFIEAEPRDGWTVVVKGPVVSWTANDAVHAMPGSAPDRLRLTGHVPKTPGSLWFKVHQSCDQTSADWNEISTDPEAHPSNPAARLDVLAPGVAPVDIQHAWMRTTVPGQTAGGVYFDVTAPMASRLVGASSPIATRGEVHEMSMDGSVMRMRALPDGLALPAETKVTLSPNGLHLMLENLKQPVSEGTHVPIDLQFVDGQGRKSTAHLEVPASMMPPAGTPEGHDHMDHMH